MITDTRKMFKSRWFRIAIIVMAITMAGGGMLLIQLVDYLKGNREWVLRINGKETSRIDFARATGFQQQRIDQIRRMYGQYADLMLEQQGLHSGPIQPAIEHIVFTTLLNQQAEQEGIVVDPDYIRDKLSDPNFIAQNLFGTLPMEVFNPQGGISESALRYYLRMMRMSHAEFETILEDAFKRMTLLHMVMPTSYVPQFIMRDFYQRQYAPRTFSFVRLDYDTVLDRVKQKGIAPGELEAFFEKHKQNYLVPEKRTGTVWQFDAQSYNVDVSDDALRSYYDKHKGEFIKEAPKVQVRRILFTAEDADKDQVKSKLEELRTELVRKPETFERVAQEQSQEEVSAADGGLVRYFARGDRVAEDGVGFERAAFILQRNGDISPVTETKKGFELLQRVGRQPKTFKAFEDVSSEITTILTQKELEKRFVADVSAFLSDKKMDESAWKAFVKKHNPKMKVITDRENDQSKQATELFALKEGEYAAYLNGQVGEVVTLKRISDAFIPDLSDIKVTVERDFYAQQAKKALEGAYDKANELLKSAGLQAVAHELGRSIENTGEIIPNNESKKELTQNNMPLGLLELTVPGATLIDKGKDLVVAQLETIQELNEKQFLDKRNELLRTVGRQFIGLSISGYIASLHKNAKIETNDSMIHVP